MLHRLQKKSPATKKAIFFGAIVLTSILIIPVWLLSIRATMEKAAHTAKPPPPDDPFVTLNEFKKELSESLQEFSASLEEFQQLGNQAQSPKNPSLPESQSKEIPVSE